MPHGWAQSMWALSAVYQASCLAVMLGDASLPLRYRIGISTSRLLPARLGRHYGKRLRFLPNRHGSSLASASPRLHGLLVIRWFAGFGVRHEFSISAGIVLWLGIAMISLFGSCDAAETPTAGQTAPSRRAAAHTKPDLGALKLGDERTAIWLVCTSYRR